MIASTTPGVTTSNITPGFTTTAPVVTTSQPEVVTSKPEVGTSKPVVTTKPDENAFIDDTGIICPTYVRNSPTNTAWSHADWAKTFKGWGENSVTDKNHWP